MILFPLVRVFARKCRTEGNDDHLISKDSESILCIILLESYFGGGTFVIFVLTLLAMGYFLLRQLGVENDPSAKIDCLILPTITGHNIWNFPIPYIKKFKPQVNESRFSWV